MKKKGVAVCAVALGLATVVAGAAKPAQWHELRSEHFHVLTDGKPKKAEEVTQKLEEFRHLLSVMLPGIRLDPPVPTTVILFRNSRSMQPYQSRTAKGKPQKNAGFMQPGTERMYLVIDLSGQEPAKTALHEYVHLVMRLTAANVPLWLNEGVAEFYEETEVRGRKFKVGFPQPAYWQHMQKNSLIPFGTFLRVDHSSEYYNHKRKQQVFYAQAWLLVHYLMVANDARRQPQLGRYLSLAVQGVPVEQAFEQAFQTDFATLQKELQRYLMQGTVNFFLGRLREEIDPTSIQVAPVSTTVALAHASDLWLNSGRLDEAEAALRELAAADPSNPQVRYRLGRVHLQRKQWREAEQEFEAALASGQDDITLRYYAAATIAMGRMQGPEGEQRSAAATRVVELLSPLFEAQTDFVDAYQLLMQARSMRGDPPAEMIPLAERLRQLKPRDSSFAFYLAQLYLQEERWEEAEALVRAVLPQTTDPVQRQRAEGMLEFLERRREMAQLYTGMDKQGQDAESAREVEESTQEETAGPAGSHVLRSAAVRRRTAPVEPPATPPQAGPMQAAYVIGTLVTVACADDTAALTVAARPSKGKAGRTLHLWVRSRARLLLLNAPDGVDALECGPSGQLVGINYRVQPREPNIAGVVITIEFDPPEI